MAEDGDIISEILARLPVKSLMRFRCVSKSWSALISDPYFTKKHLSYTEMGITENSSRLLYSLDPPQSLDHEALKDLKDHRDGYFANRELDLPVMIPGSSNRYKRIVGCCNGLICILVEQVDFMLWNPCTRYSNVLPRTKFPSYFPKFNSRNVFCGFGYDSATDDYKVIMGTRNCKQIQIFTLKTSSWKVLPLTNALDMSGTAGLLLNGSLHWLAEPQPNAGNRQTILSFDLVEEKFREMIPLPHHDAYFQGMTILRNYLCVFELLVGRDRVNTIWLMKEYGVKQSGTQVIMCSKKVMPQEYRHVFMQPICILENGELLVNDWRAGFLVLYDPKENTFKNVTKTHDQLRCGALVYRETLVSPVTGSVVDI
ncbi:F-box/kelch-repeat protein At3g06240-like [Rosa rugosa]|uniref:F-box/kelch-repeat protein At3g06240-like n=1 Tax=Rosa rugosa TaxID=74645 RepID=UPI002B40C1AF|nr:F-box/kelch-repeat protein At3g06240-like [Rosa rugosa]